MNRQCVTVCPKTFKDDYFGEHLTIHRKCSLLQVLDISSSCFDNELHSAMAISPEDYYSALSAIVEDEGRESLPEEDEVPMPLPKAEPVARLTKLTLRDLYRRILKLLVPY